MLAPAIIYEDNHLLIVQKSPGYLAQPDGSPRPDVLNWAEKYLARNKPGRAFVGLVHRLDRAVGGVLALAKTSKAASRLSRQFRERTVDKFYLALVEGGLQEEAGEISQDLVRVGDFTRPAGAGEKGTAAALTWRARQKGGRFDLLEIKLLTGFKHQIRAQLAALGRPVLGDEKYGSGHRPFTPTKGQLNESNRPRTDGCLIISPFRSEGESIGLWAEKLILDHPTTKERLSFQAAPPAFWPWNLMDEQPH